MDPSPDGNLVPGASGALVPGGDGATTLIKVQGVALVERHPAAVYLARLAPGSRRTIREALNLVAGLLTQGRCDVQTLPWWSIRYQHAQAIRAALLAERPEGPFAPSTVNKVLSALRGVVRECWRLGYIDAETYQRTIDVESARGETIPVGHALTDGELRALFEACADPEEGRPLAVSARDAAMLAILFGAGVRRAEAVALDLGDFNAETGAIAVRRGKGNKGRVVYAGPGARQAIVDWIAYRGTESGPLLRPLSKGGKVLARRLSTGAVLKRVLHLADRAGVTRFSPHDARRTFISTLIDSGADLVVVQKLAGHANVQTTARYDRRGEDAKREAAGLVHIPYRGRR